MNPTVAALNALSIFGPHQSGAYREHAESVREVLGEDIPTRIGTYIQEWGEAGSPKTVILTGNAGTGKTALAEAYCRALNVDLPEADELAEVDDQRFVVKDLSGLELEDRVPVLKLAEEIVDGDRDAQLLLCANEGLLRASLAEGSPLVGPLNAALGSTDDEETWTSDRVLIVNMNRQRWTAQDTWTRLTDYLTRDELWAGCEDCGASDECPIKANADSLGREAEREAARWLVQLASGTSVVTLRELLALLSYSITGHLECETVKNTVAQGTPAFFADTAYFNLFFGAGLTPERIERSQLLQNVREAQVGVTADLEVDEWLRDNEVAPAPVKAIAGRHDRSPHSLLRTRIGPLTYAEYGQTISISDDPDRVSACLADLVDGAGFLELWRRRVFFEAHQEIGGRAGAFRRLTRFPDFDGLLRIATELVAEADTAEHRQTLIVGLNYLSSGFHSFRGRLVTPDVGSLAARNPGSFRLPLPSMVHAEIEVERVELSLEDSAGLRESLDTDEVRAVLRVRLDEGPSDLLLTPRLHQAILESANFRAPLGGDIPEMTEVSSFYAQLADGTPSGHLSIVDPEGDAIRPVTLPSLS